MCNNSLFNSWRLQSFGYELLSADKRVVRQQAVFHRRGPRPGPKTQVPKSPL
jgi:hypothetical protein